MRPAHRPTTMEQMPRTQVTLSRRPGDPDSVDDVTLVATAPDGTILGEATVSRLYGARGELLLLLHGEPVRLPAVTDVAAALIDEIERAARSRGLTRLELDASTADRIAVMAVLEHARRRDARLQLSWPTTTPVNP